jgi:hypothetical protein
MLGVLGMIIEKINPTFEASAALLGYYAAYVDSCLPTFRNSLSVKFSRV